MTNAGFTAADADVVVDSADATAADAVDDDTGSFITVPRGMVTLMLQSHPEVKHRVVSPTCVMAMPDADGACC